MIATYALTRDQREPDTQLTWTTTRLQPVIAQFQPITLAEMADVALLDRVDTKYVLGVSQLCVALHSLTQHYRVLDINGVRLNHYQTLYFDTSNFTLYQQHHNGFGSRYKVRSRKYVESELNFLEVKHKTNRNRTVKSRICTPEIVTDIHGQADEFIDTYTPFDAADFEPKVWNDYVRVTMVGNHCQERLTLDLNVAFHWGSAYSILPGIVIAEVKQEHFSQHSNFIQQMRRLGVRPMSFSKYTAGVYSLYNEVKRNNFKSQIRQLHKLTQEELSHDLIR